MVDIPQDQQRRLLVNGYLWEDPPLLATGNGTATVAVEIAGNRHQFPITDGATLNTHGDHAEQLTPVLLLMVDVDLWRMLAAIETANQTADDDTACLVALQTTADCYQGNFAADQDQPVFTDHATTYRHQILSVYGKVAEIVELDNPDQAVTVLEKAAELDPVNEELHQRIMRIHGRAGRPDHVRRTLNRLEARLADIGQAEPSPATRRAPSSSSPLRHRTPALPASRYPHLPGSCP